jgi:hypothetical protein
MMMPSIALPTGPYDWHPETISRAVFETRVAALRAAMAKLGVTHAVVHGNCFDSAALAWLTHFTPKLGPAYALVPGAGPLRLLFAGGPGMKPSAQRLTWVEDVVAIKGVEGDIKRWLDEASAGAPVRLGLVEGEAMLRGDWLAVIRAGGGDATSLDQELAALRARDLAADTRRAECADAVLRIGTTTLTRLAVPGVDLRAAVIAMERAVYAAGAQDIRVRIARRPSGPPSTLPDEPLPMTGPAAVVLAVRYSGAWTHARFLLRPHAPTSA